MNRVPPLEAPVSLLPLPRPLMTGEVLDAAFRLFRAGLLRCLPYSGLAVLVLELPTLYSTFVASSGFAVGGLPVAGGITDLHLIFVCAVLLVTLLFGAITLRLYTISRGAAPRFRNELRVALRRWPPAVLATLGALGFPVLLFALGSMFNLLFPNELLLVLGLLLLWPTALFAVALPAFWCDKLGPFAAIAQGVRVSRRGTWRVVGAILATGCMVAVFYVLTIIVMGTFSQMIGRADLVLIAAVKSMLLLVVGTFGAPFVLAVLIVMYEDLKLRADVRKVRA